MDLILCTAVDLASLRCGAGGSARVAGKASSSNSGRTMLNSGIAAGSMTMAGVGQTASVSAERALDAWERGWLTGPNESRLILPFTVNVCR